MINSNKLTLKDTSKILGEISPITITRIAQRDTKFPKIEKIGRSIYIDSAALYVWLSNKLGHEVVSPDSALTSKDLQKIFSKSHTWIWQNVKAGTLPPPFYIGRNTYWMNSQIENLFVSEVA